MQSLFGVVYKLQICGLCFVCCGWHVVVMTDKEKAELIRAWFQADIDNGQDINKSILLGLEVAQDIEENGELNWTVDFDEEPEPWYGTWLIRPNIRKNPFWRCYGWQAN